MFYFVAKVVWFLLQPSTAFLIILLAGTALLWTGWARIGRRLVLLGSLAILVAGLSPLGYILFLPLEDRFPAAVVTDQSPPDGIIVLGGAQDTHVGKARRRTELTEAGDRLTEAVMLGRRFPEARIVFSGGAAHILYPSRAEAVGAKSLLARMGMAADRLTFEDKARDTYENAKYTKALVRPKPGERWLLVTSAFHMTRAIACFRAQGFDVLAWPVDFRTRGPEDRTRFFDKPSQGLRRVDMAAKEWIGLIVYRLTGRTKELFPGPKNRP